MLCTCQDMSYLCHINSSVRSAVGQVKYPLCVCVCVARVQPADTFLRSLHVSEDLWGPALRPLSAWFSHSASASVFLPMVIPSTKIPAHNRRRASALCMIPKTFLSYCFWNRSSSIVPRLSIRCRSFQLWLSREISWLVLARLKLVLAGLHWQCDWTLSSNWGRFSQSIKVGCFISRKSLIKTPRSYPPVTSCISYRWKWISPMYLLPHLSFSVTLKRALCCFCGDPLWPFTRDLIPLSFKWSTRGMRSL